MIERSRIRLVTVDLDDTLWPCAPTIRGAESALYDWLAERTPRLAAVHDVASMREHRRALMRARPELAHDLTLVRQVSLAELLREFGYAAELADEATAVFRRARNRVEPFDDVRPALARLRRRRRLVSVTNGNAEVRETTLVGAFDHDLTAAEVGAAKPDPALFERAMALFGAAPDETLHLGDDPRLDVDAARRHGLAAVWVNRDGRAWPGDLEPPLHEVADLHAFAAWLEAS